MDRDDDGETSYKYNTFVDDVAFEPTYLQALPIAAERNVATQSQNISLLVTEMYKNKSSANRHQIRDNLIKHGGQ